jgi:hypothetical protein
MPRFHFHLRCDATIHRDPDGTDCADVAAARAHALAVAEELMRNYERNARLWSMRVEDEAGKASFDLFFADVDTSLASHPPEVRALMNDICRRHGALIDALCTMRATLNEARMAIAGARGKPHLQSARGK